MAPKLSLARLVRPSTLPQLTRVVPAPASRRPLALASRPSQLRALHSSPLPHSPSSHHTAQYLSSSCPSCSAPLPPPLSPVCPACAALLPPPPPATSSFALFGIEPAFDLDQKALKRAFLKYQQKVHPDLFSGQGEKETWAKAWSGRVNDAFRVLEGELSRAEYLLSVSDVVIGEADAVTDPELLMSIMETREELDDATTEAEVSAIRHTNKDNAKDTLGKLSEAFRKEPPDLDAARNLVIKLRYLQNVENVCREWSPGKRIELQH